MAAFDTTQPMKLFSRSPLSYAAGIAGAIMAWNDARVTRNSLGALTDRELNDIGLIRSDVLNIADSVRH